MNTPNKLTLDRMIATPIFMATMLIDFPYHYAVSLVLFALASLTDIIDGKMARKYNLVTDFRLKILLPTRCLPLRLI